MAKASRSGEMHRGGQNAEDCRGHGSYWFGMGWRTERPLFRSRCQRAGASKVAGCQFSGTRKRNR